MAGDFDLEAEDGDIDFGNGLESFNGDEVGVALDMMSTTAQTRMKSFVERIERLQEDEDAVKTDKKEVFLEAKGEGFDVKIMRKVIARRKQDKAKRQEEEALIELYEAALEMIAPSDK
jgi:uncharacterized protein (UPF0335 family)